MNRFLGLLLATVILLNACKENENTRFKKVPSSLTDITFQNTLTPTTDLNILTYLYYYNGAGVAAADFNNDGLTDLYFTANQTADKLYLNKGEFRFEDVTEKANITNTEGWTTGVTHVDINNDGLLDIYICKVGGLNTIKGKNLLMINQGISKDGIPSFQEGAASYGLDFSGFSTQAAFFDYDLDGDLDMYLMNHSVHPNRAYGKGKQRKLVDSLSGDRFYKNEGGKFTDRSAQANIYQGKIGYGLGLGISDLDNDGYPDVYVGNDFFENDYLYINQRDGTFTEVISSDSDHLGHTTHFSMGNDIADMNNDGLTDIISLDMLPEDLKTYRTSGLEYPYATYNTYLRNGYAPQYMQNTLHLNLGDTDFSEIAQLSGIAATDWSWGPLLADFDNDGQKDLFVSNGIKGATNDMDFINFIANENIQKRIHQGMSDEDMAFIDEMPEKKTANRFYKNKGDLTFTDVSKEWIGSETSFSHGSTYADLDNDGDLDIVVNNVNEAVYILENRAKENEGHNWLNIGFKGPTNNVMGIGTKIIAYTKSHKIVQENYNSRGYLSAVPSKMHIGLGEEAVIDSLYVIWPGGAYEHATNVKSGKTLHFDHKKAKGNYYKVQANKNRPESYLTTSETKIDFFHNDTPTVEFDRDPLVPYANTNTGPSISVADIDQDGLEDIFFGGAKRQASSLFLQNDSTTFSGYQQTVFEADAINEDTSHTFFDADGDSDLDLIVVSGGNEYKSGLPLQPRLYLNENGIFKKKGNPFKGIEINASKVVSTDFDGDGDFDITLVSDQLPWLFGLSPKQYLFKNDGNGNFTDVTATFAMTFQNIGNVKDVIWADLDGNGYDDLIAVGHWMPISIFLNDGKGLRLQRDNGLENTNGWWNTLEAEDFDKDGDIDMVVGNWGNNSKFRATTQKPVTLYSYDFDANGTLDPVVTYYHGDIETPFASKDELTKQMPFLNKKYLSYKDFSIATLSELFSKEKLSNSTQKKVYELRSMYFENLGNGDFKANPLPNMAQVSTVRDIALEDFDKNGFIDIMLVGNTGEISTQLGSMDASHGLILRNNKKGGFTAAHNQEFNIKGQARSIEKIRINGKLHFVIGINNGVPILLRSEKADGIKRNENTQRSKEPEL